MSVDYPQLICPAVSITTGKKLQQAIREHPPTIMRQRKGPRGGVSYRCPECGGSITMCISAKQIFVPETLSPAVTE